MGTGNYPWRFTHLPVTRTSDGTTGDKPRTYTTGGSYWGSILTQSTTEQSDLGAVRPRVDATIRLRGWLTATISANDKITHERFSETYWIDGVRRDTEAYETVIDCHSVGGGAV